MMRLRCVTVYTYTCCANTYNVIAAGYVTIAITNRAKRV
jgi:hypothetical protein